MKACSTYLILLVACAMICSNKEGFGQQWRYDGPITAYKLMYIPDSLKTPEQKEIELKLFRVYQTNIKFRGDSIAFLLDKDGFLAEGLPEEAYLEYMDVLRQYNNLFRKVKSHIRQEMLSTLATYNAVFLEFFGYEYSGEIPLLEYEGIQYTGPGGTPSIVNMKGGIDIVPGYPKDYAVIPPGLPVDTVKFVPSGLPVNTLKVVPK